jgi:hypothetical protein
MTRFELLECLPETLELRTCDRPMPENEVMDRRISGDSLKRCSDFSIGMKDVDAAWLAAAIDGEGTISLVKNRSRTSFSPFIGVFNNNEEFCKKAERLVGSGGISKQGHCYRFTTKRLDRVESTLKEILPYLIVKKSNAKLLLNWLMTRDEKIFDILRGSRSKKMKDIVVCKNNHLKGNRGRSEQHRRSALSAVNHHLKGNRVKGAHKKASEKRRERQKALDSIVV